MSAAAETFPTPKSLPSSVAQTSTDINVAHLTHTHSNVYVVQPTMILNQIIKT